MTTTLYQLLMTVVMYALMGSLVGCGILISRKHPQVGQFLSTNPVLGWALAFAIGSLVVTTITLAAEFAAILLISR